MTNTLGAVLAKHVAAVNAFDVNAIVATFAEDAVVNDAHREFWGTQTIRAWVVHRSSSSFSAEGKTNRVGPVDDDSEQTVITVTLPGMVFQLGVPEPIWHVPPHRRSTTVRPEVLRGWAGQVGAVGTHLREGAVRVAATGREVRGPGLASVAAAVQVCTAWSRVLGRAEAAVDGFGRKLAAAAECYETGDAAGADLFAASPATPAHHLGGGAVPF